MDRQYLPRKSLAEILAGRMAKAILEKGFSPGSQLPSERELGKQFGISRSTLRETLRILEDAELIQSRQGVGWFVNELDASNFSNAREIAKAELSSSVPETSPVPGGEKIPGPKRLPASPEKPLVLPNLKTDRLGTFNLISWWERDKVEKASVMVVGAGALGNEVIKNMALMGVGNLFIVDFDTIEMANLSRSVLFRESDTGRPKSEVAAARAKELNPQVHVQYLHGDVTTQLGLGLIRRMDVVVGCLDNREARLAINRFAYWMNKPWVDGAIQEFLGLVRVFIPGQGACFECTLTELARRDLSVRYSCPLLARENILLGKVPTTPTIASILGSMQAQEALKLIHGLPVAAGKVTHYNGMTNEMHTTAYRTRDDCESHWTYGEITELPLKAGNSSMNDLLKIVQADLGKDAILELDQELILSLDCSICKTVEKVMKPISEVGFKAAHCPTCGTMRKVNMTHAITGAEDFLQRNLTSLGVPPFHILRAYNSLQYRFYELTGDRAESLHFQHFEKTEYTPLPSAPAIRLGEPIPSEPEQSSPQKGRITLKEDESDA
jgi:molybdopterin/thiamine biosynthesis adenylyltransferase/DNA-binding transcriptional regulator YhcF (GntR family)